MFCQDERDAVCTGCIVAVNTVVGMFESGMDIEGIINVITDVCVGLNLFSYVVCHGAISNYAVSGPLAMSCPNAMF
jgi:hypothetical protein